MTKRELFEWIGTALLTIGAIQVSISPEWATQWWAFIGFFLGHIIWTAVAWKMKIWPLFVLNAVFLFIDVYAIFVRL